MRRRTVESEYRKAFYHEGERLFSYPLHSETEDTQLATMEILAFQRGCALEDIGVFLEECASKERDFSRDCVAELLVEHGEKKSWRILNVTNGSFYTHEGPLSGFIAKYEAGEA